MSIVSEYVVGRKLGLAPSTIGHIKRKKLGMNLYKKIRLQNTYSEKQEWYAEKLWKWSAKRSQETEFILIMNNETYVPGDPGDVPEQDVYSMNRENEIPISSKIKPNDKSSKSSPFATTLTMTAEIYLPCIN